MTKRKKTKRIKVRNGIAKALQSPSHKQKVIPNKKKNAKPKGKIGSTVDSWRVECELMDMTTWRDLWS